MKKQDRNSGYFDNLDNLDNLDKLESLKRNTMKSRFLMLQKPGS